MKQQQIDAVVSVDERVLLAEGSRSAAGLPLSPCDSGLDSG